MGKNAMSEKYTVNLGYKALAEGAFLGESQWWCSTLWGMHAPVKSKIILWPDLNQNLLTWDISPSRGWIGPNRCALFLNNFLKVAFVRRCPFSFSFMVF
jgi:hypothetical protein